MSQVDWEGIQTARREAREAHERAKELAPRLIGRSVEDAERLAEEHDFVTRVLVPGRPITLAFVFRRINLTVSDGVVTGAHVDGG